MLNICLLTVEDDLPETIYWPIFRELTEWVFVRKGFVRLFEPAADSERWSKNLSDWRRVLPVLIAGNELVFCTVDLRIPLDPGTEPDPQHGLTIVNEIKARHNEGVRCCILTGAASTDLGQLFASSMPEVLFDFKGDAQHGYRNIVNYIKSQALSLMATLNFQVANSRPQTLVLEEASGSLRDQYLSKAPYYVDEATWHIPTLLLGARGLGQRALLEFIAYLAGAELVVVDLGTGSNRDLFRRLTKLDARIDTWLEQPADSGPRQLIYLAGLDEYQPGMTGEESENCLWPVRAILKKIRLFGSGQASSFPISLVFSTSGDSPLRIASKDTRLLIRDIEECIGDMTGYPLRYLGMDENGWPLGHPRILRLPSLQERGREFRFLVIDSRLRHLQGRLGKSLPGYKGQELTLARDVADLLADKINWADYGNLSGLTDALDAAFENFLNHRAAGQFQITPFHLDARLQAQFRKFVLNMDEVHLKLPQADGKLRTIIERADFNVVEGETLVILGPSGCGKSTLLRLFAGLLFPSSGTVSYRQSSITGPSEKIGFVFQSYSLFPWLTVSQNIAFGPRNKGVRPEVYWPRAEQLLEVARLTGLQDQYPSRLSGGEQQRVAIVRTLVNDPDVLLMDEPFGALDLQTRWQMQDFLIETRRLIEDRKLSRKTIVFVTHDIDEASYVGDRIFIASPRPLELGAQFRVPFSLADRKDSLRRDSAFAGLINQVREALLDAASRRNPNEERAP